MHWFTAAIWSKEELIRKLNSLIAMRAILGLKIIIRYKIKLILY